MPGWFNAASAFASRSNRATRSRSSKNSSGSTFNATSRSRRASFARYTSPMPPAPSGAGTSYGPIRVPGVIATLGSPEPRRLYHRLVIEKAFEVPDIPGHQRGDPSFPGALRDQGVIGGAASDRRVPAASEGDPVVRGGQGHQPCLSPVGLDQRKRVLRAQAVRLGQAGQDGEGLGERMRRKDQLFSGRVTSLDLLARGVVMSMPGADNRHEAARVEKIRTHSSSAMPRRRSWSSVLPTVSSVKGETRLRGTATVSLPRFTSRTSSGAGSISIRPSATRIVSSEPGEIPASSRILLGTTSRPARSMVVLMVSNLP